jgi:hypothetical protein
MIKSDPRARLRPCLRCGYSLRNVPDARVCPECGLSVWLTLSGNDDLEMSNPEWLARLALGSLALAAAHGVLLMGVIALHAWLLIANEDSLLRYDPLSAAPFVGGAYLALCGAGLILLGGDEGRIPERARGLRRATQLVGAVALASGAWFVAPYHRLHTPMFLVLLAATVPAVIGWAYLQQLARRIPSRRIELFAQYLWIAVAVTFASVVFRGTHWAMWVVYEPWSKFVVVWTLFLLIYPMLSIAMFAHLARTFHTASKASRKNWDSDPTPAPAPAQ